MTLPVPRSSLGAHSPHPQPARSVRILKGRKHICLPLISLEGTGSCSTAALSSCLGGIWCSCSHSSSCPLRRGVEPNLFAKVIQEGGEPHSSLGRKGEEGGSRTRHQWRLGKALADRPQGFELYQFPWNLDAAKNTWATPVRARFSLSVASSVTSKDFYIIGLEWNGTELYQLGSTYNHHLL